MDGCTERKRERQVVSEKEHTEVGWCTLWNEWNLLHLVLNQIGWKRTKGVFFAGPFLPSRAPVLLTPSFSRLPILVLSYFLL